MCECPCLVVLQGFEFAETAVLLAGSLGVFNEENVRCGMVCPLALYLARQIWPDKLAVRGICLLFIVVGQLPASLQNCGVLFKMHSWVYTGVFKCWCTHWLCFSGLFHSQHLGTPVSHCSLLLSVGTSMSVWGIILTRQAVLLNDRGSFHFISLFLGVHSHPLLSLFNCELYCFHHVIS